MKRSLSYLIASTLLVGSVLCGNLLAQGNGGGKKNRAAGDQNGAAVRQKGKGGGERQKADLVDMTVTAR